MTSSVLLRLCSKKDRGLAWVATTGRDECSMQSSEVRSPTCEVSMIMPSRFISPSTNTP